MAMDDRHSRNAQFHQVRSRPGKIGKLHPSRESSKIGAWRVSPSWTSRRIFMAILSFLANQLLPLTVALSGITLGVGLAACPMESLALQHAFVILSAITLLGLIASLVRHHLRRTPYERRVKLELGIIPLVLFWIFLVITYTDGSCVREASARTQMTNNGKQIGLAINSFDEGNKRLPRDMRNPVGTPLLSWRVSILSFVDQAPLYNRFDLTNAWDSPANSPLLNDNPVVYRSIFFQEAPGDTPWQGFVGPGTALEPGQQLRLAKDFPDGTSYTILCVEAQQQVPWSKPTDIPYGPDIPLPPLGQPYPRRGDWPFCCPVKGRPQFLVCLADGTVRMFTPDIPEAIMRALIVRNDGEPGWLPDT
jgi:uncharacterized protein DUF1559